MAETGYRTEQEVTINLLAPLFREELGYPEKDLEWAKKVKITFGRETRTKEADLVAHYKGSPVITVEAKSPTEPVRSGMSQVDSYAFALKTPISVVTNGRQFVVRRYYSFVDHVNVIDEPVDDLRQSQWKKVKNLIGFDNVKASISEPPNVVPVPDGAKIQDYRRFFRKIHNEIRDRDKLDPGAAFDELSKLLFLKAAEDEWGHDENAPILTPESIAEWERLGEGKARELVNNWFQAATSKFFPGVFDDHPRILLSPATLREVLREMQPFHVKGGDVDVKGRAFEEFLPSQLRGKGLGQFFTPRPIVNFMADMAAISIQDVVVDFSCGSGGFLIKAFEQMQRGVEQLPAGTLKRIGTSHDQLLNDIKCGQIFGVDAEPRAARTAKMNMLMWGDGRQVVRGNALDIRDFSGKLYEPKEFKEGDSTSGCTLILANPPFGSKEKEPAILKRYELAGRAQDRTSEKTEILFIEKGLKMLRPEGKMLIVLPQGVMSGTSNDRVRDHIHAEAEIRAIISLPTHAFVQSGVPTVNTCIVYLQKFTEEKKRLYGEKMFGLSRDQIRAKLRTDPDFDYPIFMGTAEYIGYEPSGRMIVEPGVKTDLDELLADFSAQGGLSRPKVNVFKFASEHYGERSHRRKDQTIRGTQKGLKTSFVVSLRDTAERLDPPYYVLRSQAGKLIDSLTPVGKRVVDAGEMFEPKSDEELDAEYALLTVSSDGTVTLNNRIRGEEIRQNYKNPKFQRVRANDVVYNPMRVNIGSIGVVPAEFDCGLVSPDYAVFRALKGISPEFLVTLLRSPFYRMYIDVVTTGSIRDRLYFSDLQSLRVPDVSDVEQATICEISRRADDEAQALLERISAERARTVDRINGLVRTASAEIEDDDGSVDMFSALVERWQRETGMLSSISKKVNHPAYKRIIEMGEPAIPYILRELREHPSHWFTALRAIAKTSPVPDGKPIDPERAADAWLRWGRKQGYIE